MLPAAPGKEFTRDALLTCDGMRAAGIGTRLVADLVRGGEIVRLTRNLCTRRGKDSHGWLDCAIACKISSRPRCSRQFQPGFGTFRNSIR